MRRSLWIGLFAMLATSCAQTVTVASPEIRRVNLETVDSGDDGALEAGEAQPTVSPAEEHVEPGILNMAMVGEVQFDPAAASVVNPAHMALLDMLYDGLTSWDESSEDWELRLATSLDPAADGLSWTATLGSHSFSDGSAITAADVERSLERMLDAAETLAAARLEFVADVVAVDESTVRIDLTEPFALLPGLLSSPVYGIVPTEPDGTVGSGPMKFDGNAQLRPVVPDLGVEAVTIASVASESDALALHSAGIVDLVFVGVEYEGAVDMSVPSWVEAHFVMNTDASDLGDVVSRSAVANAVSRSAVAESAFGSAAVAIDRVEPRTLACADPCGGEEPSALPFLPELSVGYVDEPSGVEARLAGAFAVELAALGAGAVPEGYDLDGFVGLVTGGNHHIVRNGWVGLFPSPDSQLAPYVSDSPENVSGYSSGDFDEAFAEARASGDVSTYAQAASILRADSVVVPVSRLLIRALVGGDVHNLQLRPDGSFDVQAIWVGG
ncbi:MAG: ABC transporter substrate-binding protein [Acidimicrobiales bacterium]